MWDGLAYTLRSILSYSIFLFLFWVILFWKVSEYSSIFFSHLPHGFQNYQLVIWNHFYWRTNSSLSNYILKWFSVPLIFILIAKDIYKVMIFFLHPTFELLYSVVLLFFLFCILNFGSYDFAFVDADKRNSNEYFELLLQLVLSYLYYCKIINTMKVSSSLTSDILVMYIWCFLIDFDLMFTSFNFKHALHCIGFLVD